MVESQFLQKHKGLFLYHPDDNITHSLYETKHLHDWDKGGGSNIIGVPPKYENRNDNLLNLLLTNGEICCIAAQEESESVVVCYDTGTIDDEKEKYRNNDKYCEDSMEILLENRILPDQPAGLSSCSL